MHPCDKHIARDWVRDDRRTMNEVWTGQRAQTWSMHSARSRGLRSVALCPRTRRQTRLRQGEQRAFLNAEWMLARPNAKSLGRPQTLPCWHCHAGFSIPPSPEFCHLRTLRSSSLPDWGQEGSGPHSTAAKMKDRVRRTPHFNVVHRQRDAARVLAARPEHVHLQAQAGQVQLQATCLAAVRSRRAAARTA